MPTLPADALTAPQGPVPAGAGAAAPVLVGCGHGTREPAGRRALAEVRLAIARLRPGLTVVAASVDAQKPLLDDVVTRLSEAGRRSVVVPLLLSAGYHVHVDIARAVAASGGLAVAAAALGPDPALIDLLQRRLLAAGVGPGDAVVLAAAGSSDARATADVERVAAALADLRGQQVGVGYLSAARPRVTDAVTRARALAQTGTRSTGSVAVAAYLLAPGFFADRLADVAADRVTAPLAPDDALAALALRRYDEALGAVADRPLP